MAARRLLKEHKALEKSPLNYCQFELPNDDNLLHWCAYITGPPSTPYAHGTFKLDITFPTQYPFKPPEIKFVTKIYHPNVKTETGEICTSLISENWGPTLNVRHCIEVLKNILENPDPDNPLEDTIATLMREKPKEFQKMAIKCTKDYAMG
mmetsp:Transcript_27596/g.33520  ORF Transcript_27596/g.33520 Transcript_27596/m.33520 type:complete len:151 (-) Transcript_27596:332-784(-)|eukprot:CAMPEP_0172497084 /NCGR_PEP_ID=MMETSP1066-20121228/95009_1 /TAXON_ID=671091 /ORGANISM="Coscinodiscus wailesii, Strain CCMP2513" /LENGTH=150 /DNA_ID=CAMNT_0013269669 /DNA_START=88 /DNA_END=540 /DNA_ORIENTATION=+